MVYQGSKNRLTKFLVPIIQKYIDDNNIKTYIEPMVGGANLIDKIKCDKKIGADINEELIALLKYAQTDNKLSIAPEVCTFEHYADVREDRKLGTHKYSPEYIALIGYMASYGGRYFDGGFARNSRADDRNSSTIKYKNNLNNIREQAPNLNDIEFLCCNYNDFADYKNCLFYCFDKDTEVLTNNGWKFFKDVDIDNDLFLSREPNTKKMEWVNAIKYINYKYTGKMYSYKGRQLDICVTDDHNIFGSKRITRKKKRVEFLMPAKEFYNSPNEKTFVKAGGNWQGTKIDSIKIGEEEFNPLLFARLLGIFITDGSVNNQDLITIAQSKKNIVNKIRKLLDELNMDYSEYDTKNGKIFYISKKYISYFKQFYLKENRKIPENLKNATSDIIEQLIEGIIDGDSDNERRRITLPSINLVNDVQECLYKIGKASNYTVRQPKNSFLKKENRWIKGTKPYYVVSILNTEYPPQYKENVEWLDYDDMVYCITLSKWHTVLTRRNGCTVWMGQCDPHYKNTKQYSKQSIDYDSFYDFLRKLSENNIVLVSEYNMPDDFKCIWQKERKVLQKSDRVTGEKAIEKLFVVGE